MRILQKYRTLGVQDILSFDIGIRRSRQVQHIKKSDEIAFKKVLSADQDAFVD
jgi:hypothetical protein